MHLVHGMLGQTGFRLLNAPTFLPAYLLLLSGGSDLAVGLGLALQSLGNMLTPLFGASLIEHRKRVLPITFLAGGAMRLSVLGIAVSGLLFEPRVAILWIFAWLLVFGLCSGMQQVTFSFLMSKVIPVNMRGRLTGLRNFLAGITSAAVAMAGGTYLLGAQPDAEGYSYTFILAFVLTATGMLS
ncbi:MAG: MFS transporter, partial [Gammaproteobacteria bacterium]|nr:MFS transporter [Gammaproteobacteria bacterium]